MITINLGQLFLRKRLKCESLQITATTAAKWWKYQAWPYVTDELKTLEKQHLCFVFMWWKSLSKQNTFLYFFPKPMKTCKTWNQSMQLASISELVVILIYLYIFHIIWLFIPYLKQIVILSNEVHQSALLKSLSFA